MLLNMEFSMCHLYDFKHTGILQLRIKNSKLKKKPNLDNIIQTLNIPDTNRV